MHADDAGAAPCRVYDGVGHSPPELHGQLEAHGLLTLGSVGLLEGGEVEQPLLLGHGNRDAASVADEAVDEVQLGARDEALLLVGVGSVLGHEHLGGEAGPGAVGGGRASGIAGGRHGESGGAKLEALGDGGGDAPGLEGASGIQALFLDEKVGHAQLLAEVLHLDEWRATLAQGHDVAGVVHRQQLLESPHVGRALHEAVAVDLGAYAGQVVAGVQHFAAAGADAREPVRRVLGAADGAFQMGQVTGHDGHSPRFRFFSKLRQFNHTAP